MGKSASSPSPLVNAYVLIYNLGMFLAWCGIFVNLSQDILAAGAGGDGFACLFRASPSCLTTEQVDGLFTSWVTPLIYFGFIEVVHAALGIVPGSVLTASLQAVGRLVSWYLAFLAPEYIADGTCDTPMAPSTNYPTLLVWVWALSEVIRFPMYILASPLLLGSAPFLVAWLRYSGFIVLYPIGFAAEVLCCLASLPCTSQLASGGTDAVWKPMSSPVLFFFKYIYLPLAYGIGGSYLYFTMLSSRSRRLRKLAGTDDVNKRGKKKV